MGTIQQEAPVPMNMHPLAWERLTLAAKLDAEHAAREQSKQEYVSAKEAGARGYRLSDIKAQTAQHTRRIKELDEDLRKCEARIEMRDQGDSTYQVYAATKALTCLTPAKYALNQVLNHLEDGEEKEADGLQWAVDCDSPERERLGLPKIADEIDDRMRALRETRAAALAALTAYYEAQEALRTLINPTVEDIMKRRKALEGQS